MASNPMQQFSVHKIGPEIKIAGIDLSFTNASLFMVISASIILLFLFFGSKESFIFKGQIDELKPFLNSEKEISTQKRIIKLDADDNLITINTLWDLKKIALYKPHSRYFNDLTVNQNTIIKESTNKDKIIKVYDHSYNASPYSLKKQIIYFLISHNQ